MLDIARPLDELTGSFLRVVYAADRESRTRGLSTKKSIGRTAPKILCFARYDTPAHCIPPQPLNWFRNSDRLLEGALKIRVASKNGVANSASIITLSFRKTIVYKYSCSTRTTTRLAARSSFI